MNNWITFTTTTGTEAIQAYRKPEPNGDAWNFQIGDVCHSWETAINEVQRLTRKQRASAKEVLRAAISRATGNEWVCSHYQRKQFSSDNAVSEHLAHCYVDTGAYN